MTLLVSPNYCFIVRFTPSGPPAPGDRTLGKFGMVNSFPTMRLRRLRSSQVMRDLLQEHTVSVNDLIYPIFVEEELDDFAPDQVRFTKPPLTDTYMWDDKAIQFHRCRACGCVSHWLAVDPLERRMGVNARLMDLDVIRGVRIRFLDGAVTERYVDE